MTLTETRRAPFLILFFLLLAGCGYTDEPEASLAPSTATVNEVLRITNDNIGRDDLILTASDQVTTDRQNNIYIFDFGQKTVLKFDSRGQFVTTMGRGGSGPGEFQDVGAITILKDGKLFTYDYPLQRFLIFNREGVPEQLVEAPYQNRQFKIRKGTGSLLLLPFVNEENVVHLFDTEQNHFAESLVPVADVAPDEPIGLQMLGIKPGSALSLGEDTVVYTSDFYTGTIQLYRREEDGWTRNDPIAGYASISRPYTIHETGTGSPHPKASLMLTPPDRGMVSIQLHSNSIGLFELENDRFGHLSLVDEDGTDDLKLVVEIFDARETRLLRYTILDQLELSWPPMRMPVWMDSAGFIYVLDMIEEPVVKKIEVLWEEL